MIRNGIRVRAKDTTPSSDSHEPSAPIDTALVRQLAELVSETGLAEIEIEKGDLRIRLTRQQASAPAAAAPPVVHLTPVAAVVAASQPAALDPDNPGLVKSPMVGTVYRRSNPESKPFVEIGSTVKAGDRVLLVEAMKTFNDIVAHKAGTITTILVEDNQPVEYGEPLLLIE